MGIALFTISGLFVPLQALLGRLLPAHRMPAAHSAQRPAGLDAPKHAAALRALNSPARQSRPACGFPGKGNGLRPHRTLPLRVVRWAESGIPAGSTGRMVISGRMADVCAELDRLAAMEVAP